ncbi:MAG TPA: hypothetical protein DEA08_16010 [Planctomycetes bacterium]|nr:hypothetical protein [Planctomycetota bacterium]|tara:strand:- start:261 stop:551 length:291 start_codon:yes stop_codon:yes gene_type:complete
MIDLDSLRALVREEVERALSEQKSEQEHDSTDEWLSPDQACARFNVSRSSFDRWRSDPATGLEQLTPQPSGHGGRILVPVAGFEEWLRARGKGLAQ